MGGDTSGCGERQGGSERPRRHPIGWSKNTTILFSKWKRVALSEQPTFSDFSDVSNEFDSDDFHIKRVMCSECISGNCINGRLLSECRRADKDCLLFITFVTDNDE